MTDLVNGKYAVDGLLGEGAMATVHLAVHVATERKVVLKRPHKKLLHDPIILERFEREARAAGRIRSRHVVDIIDVDRDAEGPFLVMEYLDGESLAIRLTRTPRLAADEVITIVDQLLAGAGAAHRAGVIHRDLKAGNVFLAREDGQERVKIVDFGISKVEEKNSKELTATGTLIGTIPYVSPEQIAGVAVGHQSDLWAVGIITYRCLAGTHAFGEENDMVMLARILNQEPDPLPADLAPSVITAFTPFVRRALAKRLTERFASADEMREALEGVKGALVARPTAVAQRLPMEALQSAQTRRRILTPPRKGLLGARPDRAIGAAATAFAVVLGVYTGSASARRESPRTFAVDVLPADASVRMGGDAVKDARHVAAGRPIDVGAPGFLARTIPPPSRAGARLVVGLARAPAAPPPVPSAAAPSSASAAAGRPIEAPVLDMDDEPTRAAPSRAPRPRPAVATPPAKSAIKPIPRPPY